MMSARPFCVMPRCLRLRRTLTFNTIQLCADSCPSGTHRTCFDAGTVQYPGKSVRQGADIIECWHPMYTYIYYILHYYMYIPPEVFFFKQFRFNLQLRD